MFDLVDAIERFCGYLVAERGYSYNTMKSYKSDLLKFADFVKSRGLNWHEIPVEVFDEFIRVLRKSGLSIASVSRAVSAIRSFYRYLVAFEGVDTNLTELIDVPQVDKKLPDALSEEEIDQLLAAPNVATPLGMRDRALIELLYATGLRISEALNLKTGDIDLRDRIVRCHGKGSKQRLVPFGEMAALALKRYLREGRPKLLKRKNSPFVFLNARGNKLSRSGFWKILKRYGQRVGIAHKLHPHILRHTFATHMLKGGCDIATLKELLGHASISTTQIYTKMDIAHLKEIIKKHHPRA